jgi:CRISPR-associated protein Csm3
MPHEFPKLARKIFIEGSVTALSGLHIGGSDSGLGLGGADQLVVRGANGQPYLPGSTLKGRLRSLLERATGRVRLHGGQALPCSCGNCDICRVMGRNAEEADRGGPCAARLLVRDGALLNAEEVLRARTAELPYTEVKTEIAVDRITSRASPRHVERVPAGARFALRLTLTVNEGDDEAAFLRLLFEGLLLLQDDSLGGHGSRGYGEVAIEIQRVTARDRAAYESGAEATDYPCEIPAPLRGRGKAAA